ncbi:MAG: BON domain-containing protein [Neisseriales bacterium]|nr:MAG: BON domain-containing protein [Neisseriales bacterium]
MRCLVSWLAGFGLILQLSGCASLLATTVGGVAIGSTVAAAKDRRTAGAYISDKVIIFDIAQKIKAILPDNHINVASYNRAILLTGQVLNDGDRAKADAITRNHPEVRRVFNYIDLGTLSTLNARNQDTWITAKVYCNLLAGRGYPITQLKIITEQGIVYLMGLLNEEETSKVAEIISRTKGVQKVVAITEPDLAW